MSVTIREAIEADLPAIINLYSLLELKKQEVISLDEAKCIFDKMKSYPNYRIYVALLADEIIGTFALLIMDNLAHVGKPSGIIEDVVVSSAYQGNGIGKLMMATAMEVCRKAGCYKLVLSSNLKRVQAHNFYKALGFEQHGWSFLINLHA
ncbi:MAG: GNAT family N-acetyltransferase [Proteobacteria bacterium]|nr:GNAT family N-acetyltransferase [Pseudomonadota bacterium]